MNVITKLSIDSIKSHRVRSGIICTAVILTTVLFMTILCIIFNIFGGYQLMLQLAGGSDFHVMVSGNGFNVTPDEIFSSVKAESTVAEAYIIAGYDGFSLSENPADNIIFNAVDSKKALEHLFITVIQGDFPTDTGEIMLNSAYFPDADVGQSLTLYRDSSEVSYTVSGIFKSDADKSTQFSVLTLYDSKMRAEFDGRPWIYIMFYNSINISGKYDDLTVNLKDFLTGDAQIRGMTNGAYLSASDSMFNAANISVTVFSILVVFFCSFLLIYNIYSIAVTQDIHALGQLNVIGTTYSQLRSMTKCQAVILYTASEPIGLIFGYYIGWRLLSPIFMSMSGQNLPYRFNILIPVISAGLTLFTLIFSALRPLKKLKKLTPIETLSGGVSAKSVKSRGVEYSMNPFSLALLSAARNPKRIFVTSLSAALSIILFIMIASLSDAMAYITMKDMQIKEFVLRPTAEKTFFNYSGGYSETRVTELKLPSQYAVIDNSLYETIKSLTGSGSVQCIRKAMFTADADENAVLNAEAILDSISDEWKSEASYISPLADASKGKINCIAIGIPDELCEYILLKTSEPREYYKGDELNDGSHVITAPVQQPYNENSDDILQYYNTGSIVSSIDLKNSYVVIAADKKMYSFDIISRICGYIMTNDYEQLLIMPMSTFEAEFGVDMPIYALLCDSVNRDITSYDTDIYSEKIVETIETHITLRDKSTDGDNIGGIYGIGVTGRFDSLKELRGRLNAMHITGYSLSAIIFLIGVINMVNSSLAAVMIYRREYAMLEAVGMTDRQLRIMMMLESFAGGAVAAFISLFVGIPLTKLLLAGAIGVDIPVSWIMAAVMLCALLVISVVTSLWSYMLTKRAPLTERLRIDE